MSYYTATVAAGIEDYYAGRGEAEGRWLGRGSAAGLEGTVGGEELAALFEGRHPRSGESLGAGYVVPGSRDRVAGWDLTFSAPKSVSALWAVGGGAVGLEVRDAHDAAVTEALSYLEEHAAFSRTGKAGIRQVDTEGLVAAGFVHRTSRAGDPQLHTHVLVSGRVRCVDGVWRALDSRGLHRQLKPAGMLYQAALRAELSARLGVTWTGVDRHGQAEVVGVPVGLRRLFSSRRAEVEADAIERIAAKEAELGRGLTAGERRRVFEVAVLDTRAAKTAGAVSDEGLHDRWSREADAAAFPAVSWLPDTVGHPTVAPDRSEPDLSHIRAITAELAGQSSTWSRADVVKAAARHAPVLGEASAVRRWVEAAVDGVLAQPSVVCLAGPELEAPASLRRRDGRSVFDRHDAARYATTHTLAVEQHVLDLVAAGRDAGVGVVDRRDVERAIRRAGLDGDQAAMVRAVTGDGDRVSVIVGPAGTGKTRAMAAAAHAWTDAAIPVRGLAVSAMAAGVLAEETGIRADTIAKLLTEHDRPGGPDPAWRLQPGGVVVIDEAGMVASADLARLLLLVDAAHGKAVLVGDPAQLGAVEAGGLFRLLAADPTAELGTVRRFQADWEADASLRLRHGDPTVVEVYQQHGRLMGGDPAALADEAVARWQDARQAGQSALITAADHATVDRLAQRIRAARVAAGEVAAQGLVTDAGQTVGVGDEVVTLRNDRRLATTTAHWVRNGDRWHVTALGPDGAMAVTHLDGHGHLVLPADYSAAQVALAYAVTVHKAQGVTVDQAICLVDDHTSAEAVYVGLTRGRRSNTALAVTDSFDPDRHHRPPELRDRVEVVAAALGRPGGELSATETLHRQLTRAESLATLAPRLAHLDAHIARDCPPDRSLDLDRLAHQHAHAEAQLRPGWWSSARRDDRRTLDRLEQRHADLQDAQHERASWLTANADLLAYRHQLATAVASRRRELGANAVAAEPDHLTRILGPVPDTTAAAEHWKLQAGRIEAYREEWDVSLDRLGDPPADGVQYRAWADTVRLAQHLHHIQTADLSRSIEHDHGIELSW